MYCGVPWMRFFSWPRTQAVPKSISFTWPALVSMMLGGFKSPWKTPRRCMCVIAEATWQKISTS